METNKVAVISGGAGGAGLIISRIFSENTYTVFVADRPETRERIPQTENAIMKHIGVNVFDEASVAESIEQIYQQTGHIDTLINMVGGYSAGVPIDELDTSVWDTMMQLNVTSTLLMSKYAAQKMRKAGNGRIINFAARAAKELSANTGAYSVSKSAVTALTEVQAKELRQDNITVNAVLPSIIDTPANRAAMPDADFSAWPKAEDIARVLLFLASDEAWLISGALIPVYGKW